MAQNRYIVRFFFTIALFFGALLFADAATYYSRATGPWDTSAMRSVSLSQYFGVTIAISIGGDKSI